MARKTPADTAAPTTSDRARAIVPPFGRNDHGVPIACRKVWIHVESTAKLGGLAIVALHEVPLLRKKLTLDGEVRLIGEWPERTPRYLDMTGADLSREYDRLRGTYTYDDPNAPSGLEMKIDVTADFYGPPSQSRLVAVMRRLEAAFRALLATKGEEPPTPADLEEIIALTSQDADFAGDDIPYEPAAAGKA